MIRPEAHVKEAPPQDQGAQADALKGQKLNEAVQGLALPQQGDVNALGHDETNQENPVATAGSGNGTTPADQFKNLFVGKDLKEAVSILIPNINHALKVGSTARKNEPLIQAMTDKYRALMTVSAALKSLTQNTGSSLAAQMGSNTQNQNARRDPVGRDL